MHLDSKDFLTIQQLAELRGVSRQTIYNWIEAGTAPRHQKIGGKTLFYRAEAERTNTRKGVTVGTAPAQEGDQP